jgi:hypothetical protein
MADLAANLAPMIRNMYMGMGALSKAFYAQSGQAAIPAISEIMSQGGVESGKMIQAMIPDRNMKAVGETFKMIGSMLGMQMDIQELSDEVFHFKTPSCPFGLEGTDRTLCEAMMATDRNMVSTTLGREVEMKIPQSVAAGDKVCEIIFSIK